MNKNQTKGIALIVGGILSLFILPYICQLFRLWMIWEWLEYYYLKYIIALVVAGLGIKSLITKDTNDEEESVAISINQTVGTTVSQDQINKVAKVTLVGGLIGILAGSPHGSLNKRIKIENASGWEVVQVLPDTNLNLLTLILRILLLMITLFIYTTNNGYYIVLKKRP